MELLVGRARNHDARRRRVVDRGDRLAEHLGGVVDTALDRAAHDRLAREPRLVAHVDVDGEHDRVGPFDDGRCERRRARRALRLDVELDALLLGGLSRPVAQILYIESAPALGVDHRYGTGAPGGGISFCDFDGDGADDLTLGGLAGAGLRFYGNRGDGFQKLETLADVPYEVKQILWVDTDNDGDKDLYVACYDGHNMLFRNAGNLELVDVTAASGLSTHTRMASACAAPDARNTSSLVPSP